MGESSDLSPQVAEVKEVWDEDDEYDEEDDADIDAEAQEIARRLGEEIWADISKVTASSNIESTASSRLVFPVSTNAQARTVSEAGTHSSIHRQKEEAAIATMKSILFLLENDLQAKAALASKNLPYGPSALDVLLLSASGGSISKSTAGPLSQIIVALARSEELFGNLKRSNAPVLQLDKGKRKRDELDEGLHRRFHAFKRPYIPDLDLQNQVIKAVNVISRSLSTAHSQPLDPSLVSSVRLQLHQVFLFAVTFSAAAGPMMHAFQEIGGLIQVIGVLSGIPIGQSPGNPSSFITSPSHPWSQSSSTITDIGTAVYPCLITNCNKIFSRLYTLRAHQRSHSSHRPFKCTSCPASFARNHDLKRHIKLHDNKAWKCEGCQKVFSRRDAIKRHKTGTKNRGPRSDICLAADVIEVQWEGEEGQDAIREERRAKLWNGIAVNEASHGSNSISQNPYRDFRANEDGEISISVISSIQASVMSLHSLLQALVGNALGNPVGHPASTNLDSSGGQTTLASVIARAQSQTSPNSGEVSMISTSPPSIENIPNAESRSVSLADDNTPKNQMMPETSDHQSLTSLSMYRLSEEQAQLLEIAIANAASAAQAQAEAEAAMEEAEEEEYDQDDNEYDDSDMEKDQDGLPISQ